MKIPASVASRISSIVLWAIAAFLLLALASYHPADLSVLSSHPNHPLHNIGGVVGAWLAFVGRTGVGWASFVLPLMCGFWALRVWAGQMPEARWLSRTVASLCLLASLGVLAALGTSDPTAQTQAGGIVGYLVVLAGRYYLGATGTALVAICLALLSWCLVTDQPLHPRQALQGLARVGQGVAALLRRLWPSPRSADATASKLAARSGLAAAGASDSSGVARAFHRDPARPSIPLPSGDRAIAGSSSSTGLANSGEPLGVRIRSTVTPKPKVLAATAATTREANGGFQLPSLELLQTPPPLSERQVGEDLRANAKILEDTLRDFGIEARCMHIDRGPAVTRYELAPAPGVKLTRIVALADDLALVMKAASCHIVAPIPGKGLVGIEVPNSTAAVVSLKEVLASRELQQIGSPLALAIGKDVSGQPVVCDLRECPHLLIAGATGSGKTVCLNSVLTGILYQAGPDDVKFLMIDPKMVELVLFNDIPHLVTPVVTSAKRAAASLAWAVKEMERRYQVLARYGVRHIEGYNQKVKAAASEIPEGRMPYLVIVIDELADLMIVASQDVEEAITRLAQLSRAVGLHIILATQRPSVDVITGVIKANFPARIAFQVASKVDSRTILDVNGADKLLGRGDLMFLQPGKSKPIRAQGSLVTDEEIERVVNFVKAQRQPTYDEQLITQQERPVEALITEKDELYEMAKQLVLENRQASTSLLQRRLRLGYARAARILDLMEQEGLVGPPQGSRPREVLVESNSATKG